MAASERFRVRINALGVDHHFGWPTIFGILIIAMAAVFVVYRFAFGLGASTNLSDPIPWGIWIGFDVICGIALAAGGFTITAACYIFGWEKYHELARPATLMAFLGYFLAGSSVILDLGQHYKFWQLIVYPQVHSVMLEVGYCVVLYLLVLAMEVSPGFFRKVRMPSAAKFFAALTIPLVIAGITLSTLHQSSLGHLYLLAPGKLFPYWYTPFLGLLFFVSAICVGIGILMFEGYLSHRHFMISEDKEVMSGLAKGAKIMLLIYAVLKLIDLAVVPMPPEGAVAFGLNPDTPRIALLFSAGYPYIVMIWLELILQILLPLALLFSKSISQNPKKLAMVGFIMIIGLLINRLSIVFVGYHPFGFSIQESYFPSFMEWGITAGIIAFEIVVFVFLAKWWDVFDLEKKDA